MPKDHNFSVYFRMGIAAERNLFQNGTGTYDGVVISAYFAAFYRASTPVILRALNKPFFFDPVTYVFARDIENIRRDGDLRKSFQKLVEWYGGEFKPILNNRQLIPKDFFQDKRWDTKRVSEFVAKTLDIQHRILSQPTSIQQSLAKYAELSEGEKPSLPKIAKLEPEFLVAPYFSFESTKDPWYMVTAKLAQEARKQCTGKLFVPICFSKELLLQEREFEKIRGDFKACDGYLVWPSDFNDDRDAFEYLEGLTKFVKTLARQRKPIYFLYGGFFVPLLWKVLGIVGACCRGICYGESKDVDAIMATGGGAPVRYYYSRTFSKLPESVARTFFSDHPRELCKCSVCSVLWKQAMKVPAKQRVARFFDLLDFMSARIHFMESHAQQIAQLMKLSQDKTLNPLKESIEKTRDFAPYGVTNLHLARWLSALQRI